MLFRGVGVPARYVEGVAARLPHYTDKTVQLKDKNAHAWVEIYCDDIGWLPVEVTPEGGGGTKRRPLQPAEIKDSKKPKKEKETETEEAESFEPEEGELEEDIPPEEDVPPEEEQPVEEDLSEDDTIEEDEEVPEEETDEEEMEYEDTEDETQTGGVDQPAEQSESKPENGWSLQALIVLAIVVAVFMLVHGQYLLRKWVYRKRLRKLDKRSRVIRMFLHSRPLLAKYGVSYEGETSTEYAAGLAEATGLSEESVQPFVYGLLKAEFGGNHLTEEESKEFVQAYRKITRALFGKMKLPMRILFLYVHGGK